MIKTIAKPIAAFSATGGLEYNTEDQKKALILAYIANLMAIALLSELRPCYLLGNVTDTKELYENQPEVTFSIPPDPSTLPKYHEVVHTLFTFLIKNSSITPLLNDENYTELNNSQLKRANCD
ncbi:hypothetical protein CLU79DRAFT_699618 [Phycomyces nitens]|nr:hypothetical protein CLU79DRAFT_699618 [Phycomyces nitens]